VDEVIALDGGEVSQQAQTVRDDAIDLHEGEDGLRSHHSSHVVVVLASLLNEREDLQQLLLPDLFQVHLALVIDLGLLLEVEGEEAGEQEDDRVEGRVHGIEVHVLQLLSEEANQQGAAVEKLE
jgi:hypothetical protein